MTTVADAQDILTLIYQVSDIKLPAPVISISISSPPTGEARVHVDDFNWLSEAGKNSITYSPRHSVYKPRGCKVYPGELSIVISGVIIMGLTTMSKEEWQLSRIEAKGE